VTAAGTGLHQPAERLRRKHAASQSRAVQSVVRRLLLLLLLQLLPLPCRYNDRHR